MTRNLFFDKDIEGKNKIDDIKPEDSIKNKQTKSKYFQFIKNNLVISQVISYNGTIIPLPKDWSLQKVKVVFNIDGTNQETYVKDNGNISYITVAKIYLGTNALINLLPQEQEPKKDNFISKTIKNMATSTICFSLSIYFFVIVT